MSKNAMNLKNKPVEVTVKTRPREVLGRELGEGEGSWGMLGGRES